MGYGTTKYGVPGKYGVSGPYGTTRYGAGFHPAKLKPIFMVWRGQQYLTLAGQGVSVWDDIGSVNNDPVQATDAERPTLTDGTPTFNGDDENFDLGTILAGTPLQLNGVIPTIIAFIIPTNVGTRDTGGRIISKSTGGAGDDGYEIVVQNGADAGKIGINIDGATDLSTNVLAADDVLSMVGGMINGAASEFISAGKYVETFTAAALVDVEAPAVIGGRPAAADRQYEGQQRGIIIFDYALTASQLLKVYNWGISH